MDRKQTRLVFNYPCDPIADGGYPTRGGVMPADASHLSSFLDDWGNDAVYNITFEGREDDESELLWDITVDATDVDQSSDPLAIVCTPLAPNNESYRIGIDEINLVSIVEPPPTEFTETATTPTEEAIGLRRLAQVNPERVNVSSLLSFIERGDTESRQRHEALNALRYVATSTPEDCTPAIPILRSLLETGDLRDPSVGLGTLSAIGDANPGDIAPTVDVIIPYLRSNQSGSRREAAKCLAAIVEEDPSDGLDAISSLRTIIEDGSAGQNSAVLALARIAGEYPEAVTPVVDPLADILVDKTLSDSIRMSATAAVGRVVKESPHVAVSIVDEVIQLFEADSIKLRNNAIALIYDMAAIHTDVIEPFIDDIAALLVVDDEKTRINASGAIARVANDFPESVNHLSSTVVELLDDESPDVRLNACWTLGYLRATEAQDHLEELERRETNRQVRARADWALSRIASE